MVAQTGPEPLDDPGGVVASPVEPLIHHGLDPAAGRLEQRRHGQGGPGNGQARVPAQNLAEDQGGGGVAPPRTRVSSP